MKIPPSSILVSTSLSVALLVAVSGCSNRSSSSHEVDFDSAPTTGASVTADAQNLPSNSGIAAAATPEAPVETKKPGPAERVGEKIDHAAHKAAEGLKSAGHAVRNAAENARQAVGETLKNAGEKISN